MCDMFEQGRQVSSGLYGVVAFHDSPPQPLRCNLDSSIGEPCPGCQRFLSAQQWPADYPTC